MSARSGMTDLISELRGLTDAGPSDFALGTVTYWNDEALQKVLDRNRVDFTDIDVEPQEIITGGTAAFYTYVLPCDNLESGTILQVKDPVGNAYGTAVYSVDYTRGVITWATNTLGSSILICGRTYDLNAAAADVWKFKLANASKMYDFSTDNHRMSRSQYYTHCREMITFFAGQAGPVSVQMVRSDMDGYDVD